MAMLIMSRELTIKDNRQKGMEIEWQKRKLSR